jgi:hydrogenase maturation protease
MPGQRPEILILGIGNILMADDGVGIRVIERLRSVSLPTGIEVVDGGTSGADLVDILAERRKAIVIDAIDVGAQPGTIMRFAGDAWTEHASQAVSLHEVGLGQAISMVRLIGVAPKELVVFGIQIQSLEPSLELSRPVEEAIGGVVQQVLAEIDQVAR